MILINPKKSVFLCVYLQKIEARLAIDQHSKRAIFEKI